MHFGVGRDVETDPAVTIVAFDEGTSTSRSGCSISPAPPCIQFEVMLVPCTKVLCAAPGPNGMFFNGPALVMTPPKVICESVALGTINERYWLLVAV